MATKHSNSDYVIQLYRDFYENDATTQLTMEIIEEYAVSMFFSPDQDCLVAEFKNANQLMQCAASILAFVSNLSTGNVEIWGVKEKKH